MLQKNIDRLEAAKDFRTLQIAVGATTSEGVKQLNESYRSTIGQIVEYDLDRAAKRQIAEEKLDREGLDRLRGKGKLR